MKIKLEEIIRENAGHDQVTIEGDSLPLSTLKGLLQEGYIWIQPYKNNKTFSLWGKNCTACFTGDQIRHRT